MIRPQDDPRGLYTLSMREAHAESFIMMMAEAGPEAFEKTQSKHVGPTYGLPPSFIRELKARFRNELSFGECGK